MREYNKRELDELKFANLLFFTIEIIIPGGTK